MVVRSAVEQQLHAQIDAGDFAGAAEQLVLAYGSEVLGRCRTLVGDRAVAEDLAQDAFCRAFSALAGFRGEASLRTWLFTIVRNVCIDHHRRLAGAAWRHDDDADAEEQPEERPFLIQLLVDREQLERALAGLEERERALIVLRFVHGMEHAELAACFGLREGTVRMRLCRALARMRDTLGQREDRSLGRAPVLPRASRIEAPGEARAEAAVAARSVEHLGADRSLPMMELPDEQMGLDALPPLARALGLALEGAEARPPVEALLRSLRPTLAGLRTERPASGAPVGRKSWLGWLFKRPTRP